MRHLDIEIPTLDEPDIALVRLASAVGSISRVTVDNPAADDLRITEHWRPIWTFAIAVLLFPLGLFALLIKNEAVLSISVIATAPRTVVRVEGKGHEAVCDRVLAVLQAVPST